MLRKLGLTLLLLFATSAQGCLFAHFTTPLDTDLNNTVLGDKSGESSIYSVLGLVAWGDGGTRKAAENGGITTLTHADRRTYMVLWGLFTKYTTIVHGK